MSMINNGGPAFARPMGSAVGRYSPSQEGASLRDYFAIRAPLEIPAWFKYTPGTPRPVVPVPHEVLTPAQYKEWDGLDDWLELRDVCQEVRDFHVKYTAASDAAKAWDLEREIAHYFSWRWHYADGMLAMRGAA
jgi:hypothetical protein